MKKTLFLTVLLSLAAILPAEAQRKRVTDVTDYNRSSLYTITILHTKDRMYNQMFNTMIDLPNPEKYNDHNLSLRILTSQSYERAESATVQRFLASNQIAKRMVSKWFDRDKKTGAFDVNLVAERGSYNATVEDLNEVMMNVRGLSMLDDAGEQLIPNTFLLVNEITYVDKEEQANNIGAGIMLLGGLLGAAIGGSTGDMIRDIGNMGAAISQTIAGFRVDISTQLYRLKWSDDIANTFYASYYYDADHIDPAKKEAFENDRDLFKLEYIGEYSARSAETVTRGLYRDEDVFEKVLSRAIDENIVQLQRRYDMFKVVSSIASVNGNRVSVHIGMKEGVTTSSRYEVVERTIDRNGAITYRQKGIIKPVSGQIWDNRCMAFEERATGSALTATVFETVSGTDFYPGLLVRELSK